ncbi:MAG: lipopolysaccharide biosynthesis protein [Bacteroidales bacterium]|nr:lipopolysaccharide biosynthesis protein [Bacteroidales bacterium]
MQLSNKIKNFYQNNIASSEVVTRFAKVFSVDVVVRAVNFLLIPVFLHLMSKEEVGTYDYLYSFAFAMAPALNLGLYVSLTKMYHLYDNPKDKGRLLLTINFTLITFLLIVFGVIYGFRLDYSIFSFLVNQPIAYEKYRFFILLAMICMIYNVLLTMFFVTSEKISKIQRYNIGRCLLVNIAVFAALIFLKGDKVALRLGFTYVSEFIVGLYFFRYYMREMATPFSKEMMLRAIKIGMPIMLSSIAYLLINFADKYYVQRYCGMEDFAVYFKALQFATILSVVFNSFQNVWLPIMMKEKDLTVLNRKTNRVCMVITLLFTALSLCIIFAVWVALKWNIIPMEYYDMLYVLPLACLGQIASVLMLLYQYYAVYFEKTHINLFVTIVSGILGVVCNYFAVRYYSYYGVAVVMIFINILMLLFYFWRSRVYIRNRLK